MRFSRDRRGQSVVVGTVILFGFLILALSLYQVQVVPQENSDVEYEHSQQVEGEFLDLRNAILSTSRTGAGQSTSVKLGTRYPQRTFALNPPPATGRLSTSDPRELRIENATVEGKQNVVNYWDNRTEMDGAIAFDTRSLRYSPRYNEFQDGPDLVYEHSLVVAEFEDAALGRSGQTVVDSDNRLRLTALNGDVDESGIQRTSLDPDVLSRNRRSVRLNSTGTDPVVIELPTDVSADRADGLEREWSDRLSTDAESVSVAGGTIRIELDGSESYRLGLGAVGLGDGTSVTNESDGYITNVSSDNGVAVAEVRDRYNNPVEGAQVNITVDGSFAETARTNEEGRVSYEVTEISDVEMEINAGTETWESVLFENVGVATGGGGGGPESLLAAPGEAVAFNGPGSSERGGFQLDVENQHDGEIRITDVTVIPEDPTLNGLSDEAPDSGPGRSELYVESDSGVVGSKNVLMIADQQFAFVSNDGLQLNLQRGPQKQAYDIDDQAYVDVDTEFSGSEVPLGSNENATITLAEFYEVGQSDATVVDVTGERFSVTVGYKINGERRTEQFVKTVVSRDGEDQADQVSGVAGTVDGSNIGSGGGSRVEFDISAEETVSLEGFSVATQNELAGVGFTDEGSTFGGAEPPTSITGQVSVDLVEFDTNNIQNDLDEEFVDPGSPNAKVIVTLQFSDGSSLELGIS